MKMRTYQFNLIEIVLTVAVIAFGVVGMVAGLVVGLKLCKKTVQEKPSATEESAPTEETAKEMLSGNE